jgi:signal transduction histidine kinase/DNA-binding NarL/FixJ family response regulator
VVLAALAQRSMSRAPHSDALPRSPEISSRAVDEALDGMLAASLRPVCVGLALFYALLACWYLLQHEGPVEATLSWSTALFSFGMLAAAVWFERNQLPAELVRSVTALIGAAIIFICLLILVTIPNARQTTHLMIAQLGFGCLLLSMRWFLVLALCASGGWLWVAGDRIFEPDWQHFGFALVQAMLFGALVLTVRIRAYRSIQTLRMRDQLLAADLREANHAVECAARAKTEFLANMSHEIRTPMTAMLGMTELLQLTPLDAQQAEYATTIERSGDTLLKIVNDILDFSKIEAGRVALEEVSFDSRGLLGEVQRLLEHRARDKRLALHVEVDPTVPSDFLGDPTRIKQVLINLAGNAIKFTHHGSVKMWARSRQIDDIRTYIEFGVTDTGIGIAEDQRDRVFEAFTQADASTTRRYGGTGLGLAISARLVRLMGGEIRLESEPGAGSTFTVSLVLKVSSTKSAAPASAQTQPTPLYHARVLIVEDNLDNQTLAERMLRHLGCDVDIATDGRLAIECMERGDYDVVFMDCHMPNLNGYEATREIRRREAARGTHSIIVALSASVLPEERQRCIEVGMDDYVAKPFNRAEIQRVLKRWIGDAPRPRSTDGRRSDRAGEPRSAEKPLEVPTLDT